MKSTQQWLTSIVFVFLAWSSATGNEITCSRGNVAEAEVHDSIQIAGETMLQVEFEAKTTDLPTGDLFSSDREQFEMDPLEAGHPFASVDNYTRVPEPNVGFFAAALIVGWTLRRRRRPI